MVECGRRFSDVIGLGLVTVDFGMIYSRFRTGLK